MTPPLPFVTIMGMTDKEGRTMGRETELCNHLGRTPEERLLLRRVLGKTTLEQRVSKYIVSTVRFVLWVVTVLIVKIVLGK